MERVFPAPRRLGGRASTRKLAHGLPGDARVLPEIALAGTMSRFFLIGV